MENIEIIKEAFIEGYKQRAESSNLIFDNVSRMYAISLFDEWIKQINIMEEKYYEILRHYVNPNDCAIVVKQLLSLHNVSQQRELLENFADWMDTNVNFDGIRQEEIDSYIAEKIL